MDTLKALAKRLKSYTKKDWEFNDYPINTWKNQNASEDRIAFGAGIVNWQGIVGHGETLEKALNALKESFQLYKDKNESLPRPGTKVPFKFASTENIDKYEIIAVDFFNRVLEMDYYGGFYSDMSFLSFFEPYDNVEKAKEMKMETINRTHKIYNVEISDIYDEPLWRIFERIENNKNTIC